VYRRAWRSATLNTSYSEAVMGIKRTIRRYAIRFLICFGALFMLPISGARIFAQSAGTVTPSGAASQPTDALSPEVASKAKDLKVADAHYVKMLCDDDLKKQRAQAKDARDSSEAELTKAISNDIDHSVEVQKALDIAAAAGDDANKVVANPTASEQDKTLAKEKFQKAKDALRDAIVKEKARIEGRIKSDFGVALGAPDSCPDSPKAASNRKSRVTSVARERSNNRSTSPARESSPTGGAPVVGGGPVGGGISIGVGGIGITFGH